MLLDYIETDLLSSEAIELAVAEYRDEAKKLRRKRQTPKPPAEIAVSVARIDREIEQLKQMIRAGTMTAATLRPAIDAAETERARLLAQTEKTVDLDIEKIARLLPNAVGEYRTKVARLRDGRGTLSDAEYIETRRLIFDLLDGSVPVEPRTGGTAALHLEIDVAPIAKAYGSMTYKLVAGGGFGTYLRHCLGALPQVSELPARFYTDPGMFEDEKRQIFHRARQCLGQIGMSSRPGDYFTGRILDQRARYCGISSLGHGGPPLMTAGFMNVGIHVSMIVARIPSVMAATRGRRLCSPRWRRRCCRRRQRRRIAFRLPHR